MGKVIIKEVLMDYMHQMMESRHIDRLPMSDYSKAIEDIAKCPTVDSGRALCTDCYWGKECSGEPICEYFVRKNQKQPPLE